jgi:hypothetical protein
MELLVFQTDGAAKHFAIASDTEVHEIEDEEVQVIHGVRDRRTGSQFAFPSSPDIDPYEDGYTEFVYDYSKMKKVHNYDWKWVEVAVFAYDAGTKK